MDDIATRNLDRMRDIYARYAKGEVDAVFDNLAPDAVWETEAADLPWSGCFDCQGVRGYFARLGEVCEVRDYTVEQIVAGDDLVVALASVLIHFRATGQEERFRKVDTIRMKEGRIVEFREYYDTARVKAALR